MIRVKFTKEQLEEAVTDSFSIRQVCLKLGRDYRAFPTIKSYIQKYGIDMTHFLGQRATTRKSKLRDISTILVENSQYSTGRPYSTNAIKGILIRRNLKEEKCEICGMTHWMGKDIPLEAHHINGINNDNRIENLQLLCPNCHAQTDNYKGANTKVHRAKKLLTQ